MTKYTVDAHALPYPEGADKVAVHGDIQALAVKTGAALTQEGARVEGVAAELIAAVKITEDPADPGFYLIGA